MDCHPNSATDKNGRFLGTRKAGGELTLGRAGLGGLKSFRVSKK